MTNTTKSKNTWKDDVVDVEKLELDLQNPRLPKHVKNHNDVTQIRNYLLNKEGVLRIARSIANNGYHRSAVAIVCKENGITGCFRWKSASSCVSIIAKA